MKNVTLMFVILLATLFTNGVWAITSLPANADANTLHLLVEETYGMRTIHDFLELTPKQIREATGEKLNLKEVVVLKAAQKKVKKALKGNQSAAANTKNQLVALLLAIFLGGLGIHRFYLGYTGIGIIQLLTLGGCGIWALIDVIRIATGDLQPKDGRYDPEL